MVVLPRRFVYRAPITALATSVNEMSPEQFSSIPAAVPCNDEHTLSCNAPTAK